MGFFRSTPPPPARLHHPEFGTLVYSSEDEEYAITYNGHTYLISLGKDGKISEHIFDYLRDLDARSSDIEAWLASSKEQMIKDWPLHKDEINGLKIESLCLSDFKGKYMCCFITLSGGEDYRAWRFEIRGLNPVGLGFDS